jgi:hypothetical protein
MDAYTQAAAQRLVGRTIREVRFMEGAPADYWSWIPFVLVLDDGSTVHAEADEEGNDGGVLVWSNGDISEVF